VHGGTRNHFATMPYDLAHWALKSTLPPGGTCIDPFMGAGTTGIAALAHGGRFVGVDVREDYMDEFVDRLSQERATRPRIRHSEDQPSQTAFF